MSACGGAYTPAQRRKYFLTGPQWAAAYEGHALFHAPTRRPVGFEEVIREYARDRDRLLVYARHRRDSDRCDRHSEAGGDRREYQEGACRSMG